MFDVETAWPHMFEVETLGRIYREPSPPPVVCDFDEGKSCAPAFLLLVPSVIRFSSNLASSCFNLASCISLHPYMGGLAGSIVRHARQSRCHEAC